MRTFQKVLFAACLGGVPVLSGCGKFFPPIPPPCTTNCTTSNNFLYVANAATSAHSVAGFTITGTNASPSLNVAPNSPYNVGIIPSALAITPNNKFMYVASAAGGIYLYVINSDGSITLQNNSSPVGINVLPQAIQVDTTGSWLIVTNVSSAGIKATITVFSIDANTGLLTASGNPLVLGTAGATNQMLIAPNNQNVYISLTTSGVESLTFDASSGALADQGNLGTLGANHADLGLASDPSSKYLFVTETASPGLRVLAIQTSGALTEVTGSPFQTGAGPAAVLVESSGSYVYVANKTDNTISGFILPGNGTLTAISGSPYATGTTPVSLAEDNAKAHLAVACQGGNHDLELYSFDATTGGKLDSVAHSPTGADPTTPIAVVATH